MLSILNLIINYYLPNRFAAIFFSILSFSHCFKPLPLIALNGPCRYFLLGTFILIDLSSVQRPTKVVEDTPIEVLTASKDHPICTSFTSRFLEQVLLLGHLTSNFFISSNFYLITSYKSFCYESSIVAISLNNKCGKGNRQKCIEYILNFQFVLGKR